MGSRAELNDWRNDPREDIALLMAKLVNHPHYAEACREFPEVERAPLEAKALLDRATSYGQDSEEALQVLDEVAIALGRVQTKFGR